MDQNRIDSLLRGDIPAETRDDVLVLIRQASWIGKDPENTQRRRLVARLENAVRDTRRAIESNPNPGNQTEQFQRQAVAIAEGWLEELGG